MSDLQIALAVIGAIVIAAVIAYNKWQEARLSKRADRDFGSRHDDVLVARERCAAGTGRRARAARDATRARAGRAGARRAHHWRGRCTARARVPADPTTPCGPTIRPSTSGSTASRPCRARDRCRVWTRWRRRVRCSMQAVEKAVALGGGRRRGGHLGADLAGRLLSESPRRTSAGRPFRPGRRG